MLEPRPWRRSLMWLALLGPLFFATYGFANWVSSLRVPLDEVSFAWERQIPFLAWTIVPYWSIDLFYGVSLLVCRTRTELDTHARRLLGAQLICIACFLLWPLQFSWQRPPSDGLFGAMFDLLMGFDKPYNQMPSLHIVLLIILWVCYARHCAGVLRGLLHAWFALIGVSVLTTWQHHFIDIPTGLAVGWLCVWLWPQDMPSPLAGARFTADPHRRRLALTYLAGAAICAVAGFAIGGWGLWLLWPALSLALVASCDAFFGCAGFQKSPHGRLSHAAMWLFAPYLVGAWVNSRAWTRAHPDADPVADGVWLGRLPSRRDLAGGRHAAVVDVCAELPVDRHRCAYRSVPMLDLVVPDPAQLASAASAIEAMRASGPVLVCCALGYSRSAAAIAAWLMQTGRASGHEDAITMIRRARPHVVLAPAHQDVLAQFAALKA
ncbi:MAG: phosphatase PAP2 family protein [Rhodocyclaceae bacterium]|nr:MAG: phosphatase PAP2 family protein [Rhodocyclaceae bacterium]